MFCRAIQHSTIIKGEFIGIHLIGGNSVTNILSSAPIMSFCVFGSYSDARDSILVK